MSMNSIRKLVLLGPTAVGKTKLSIRLANRLETSIVSVDARQSYRYLDIGTAKASAEQRQQATLPIDPARLSLNCNPMHVQKGQVFVE